MPNVNWKLDATAPPTEENEYQILVRSTKKSTAENIQIIRNSEIVKASWNEKEITDWFKIVSLF